MDGGGETFLVQQPHVHKAAAIIIGFGGVSAWALAVAAEATRIGVRSLEPCHAISDPPCQIARLAYLPAHDSPAVLAQQSTCVLPALLHARLPPSRRTKS